MTAAPIGTDPVSLLSGPSAFGRPKRLEPERLFMSVDTDAELADDGADVVTMGRELGDAIAALPEYETYEEARVAVEQSEEAQEQISEFEQLRREFLMAQQVGEADQEDLQELQEAQLELHDLPVMAEFLAAQNELNEQLEAVNIAISEPLSVDFGEEAGGCCHD